MSAKNILFAVSFFCLACQVVSDADADAEAARVKKEITMHMATGIQNSIELRQILIKKQMDESDFAGAMEQYRHIVRIQTNAFGAGSPEVESAEEQAQAHLKLLLAHERDEFQAFSDIKGAVKRKKKVKELLEANNILLKEFVAQQYAMRGDNSGAARRYKDIAETQSRRYGENSPEHVSALKLARKHEEL